MQHHLSDSDPVTRSWQRPVRPARFASLFRRSIPPLSMFPRFADAADQMIDLAKTLNNDANMIALAKIFVQQPLDSSDSLAVPYCQNAPQNTELKGFYHCQFKGATQNTFTGNIPVGQAGTVPYGLTTPVSPAGSWYVICVSLYGNEKVDDCGLDVALLIPTDRSPIVLN
jgi:hypothetical protein